MESDVIYFGRRASEERTAALHAPHPQARQSHLELAERYEDLVRAIAESEQQLVLRIVRDGYRPAVGGKRT